MLNMWGNAFPTPHPPVPPLSPFPPKKKKKEKNKKDEKPQKFKGRGKQNKTKQKQSYKYLPEWDKHQKKGAGEIDPTASEVQSLLQDVFVEGRL